MKRITSFLILSTALVTLPAFAGHKHHCHCKKKHRCAVTQVTPDQNTIMYKDVMNVFTPNWYAGAHMGLSRAHDSKTPGTSTNSMTQIGPGWTVDLGYKFFNHYNATLAGELGFTQYHNSVENTVGAQVATTEHFATYGAAVLEYPLCQHLNIMGKLGLAYSYAKKVFTATGTSASATVWSPYYGAGFEYNVTQQAAIVLQWARARGNNKTGSTDLTSLGITYNFL